MRKWPFVLGLGAGIAVMSLLLLVMHGSAEGALQQNLEVFQVESARIGQALEELSEQVAGLSQEGLSDDEIVSMASAMGMSFAEPEALLDASGDYSYEEQADYEEEPDFSELLIPAQAPALPSPSVHQEYTYYMVLQIASGANLSGIVSQLYETGVIDDEEAFTQFVIEQGSAGRLLAGTRYIARDAGFEEILQALTSN